MLWIVNSIIQKENQKNNLNVGYNIHSIYSIAQAEFTQSFLNLDSDSPSKLERNQLLTRSSFAGTGQYASHYLSDYSCTFEDMRRSILDVFNLQLFGIPHTGAPV